MLTGSCDQYDDKRLMELDRRENEEDLVGCYQGEYEQFWLVNL